MDTRLDCGTLGESTGSQWMRHTQLSATIHPDHLAAAADACAEGFRCYDGSRAVSAGDGVRRYNVVKVLLSDGVQRWCLSVREPGWHRQRVFLPEGLEIAQLGGNWRYRRAEQSNLDNFAHDLPELARRLLPVMHRQPDMRAAELALVCALRDQLPAVEAAAMAGLPVPTPWSVPRMLIPTHDDRPRHHLEAVR